MAHFTLKFIYKLLKVQLKMHVYIGLIEEENPPHVIYRSRKKLYKAIQGLFQSLSSMEKYQKVPKLPQWLRPTGFQKANAIFIEKLFWKICLHLLVLEQLSTNSAE